MVIILKNSKVDTLDSNVTKAIIGVFGTILFFGRVIYGLYFELIGLQSPVNTNICACGAIFCGLYSIFQFIGRDEIDKKEQWKIFLKYVITSFGMGFLVCSLFIFVLFKSMDNFDERNKEYLETHPQYSMKNEIIRTIGPVIITKVIETDAPNYKSGDYLYNYVYYSGSTYGKAGDNLDTAFFKHLIEMDALFKLEGYSDDLSDEEVLRLAASQAETKTKNVDVEHFVW